MLGVGGGGGGRRMDDPRVQVASQSSYAEERKAASDSEYNSLVENNAALTLFTIQVSLNHDWKTVLQGFFRLKNTQSLY